MSRSIATTKLKFDVTNRFTRNLQFTAEIECDEDATHSVKLGLAAQWGVKNSASLAGANLVGADLVGADLVGADLARTDLAHADLEYANLAHADLEYASLLRANLLRANLARTDLVDANLEYANLVEADLVGANLLRANLVGANLAGANLVEANLKCIDLVRANLVGANLEYANLAHADLECANLADANLVGAKNAELAIARTRILPEGSLVVWKKCNDGILAKLRVPEEARRSHAWGRKCRAEFVDVIEVIGADEAYPWRGGKEVVYRAGERVTCDTWEEDWTKECAGGIHFFLTREEAEDWSW